MIKLCIKIAALVAVSWVLLIPQGVVSTGVVAAPADWKMSALSAQLVGWNDQEGVVNEPVWGYLITGRLGLIAVQGSNPEIVLSKPPQIAKSDSIPNRMKLLIKKYSNLYGVSKDEMYRVMFCESRGDPFAWNKNDPNNGSKGLFQYQDRTFYYYAGKIGIENPDIWDIEQQIKLTAWLFSQNKQSLWSCWKKLT